MQMSFEKLNHLEDQRNADPDEGCTAQYLIH